MQFCTCNKVTISPLDTVPVEDARMLPEMRDVRSETMLSRRHRAVLGRRGGGGRRRRPTGGGVRTGVGGRERASGLFCRRNWIWIIGERARAKGCFWGSYSAFRGGRKNAAIREKKYEVWNSARAKEYARKSRVHLDFCSCLLHVINSVRCFFFLLDYSKVLRKNFLAVNFAWNGIK